MSYIGLFSWYNFDNWAYQPSYVSSNTPFFFNGLRIQLYPTEKLKFESWIINGWQSYGRFNNRLGIGFQVLYRSTGAISTVSNGYGLGEGTLGVPDRVCYHSDSNLQVKYYDHSERTLDRMAFSVTGDTGCEHGGGVSCAGNSAKGPKQSFLGFMLYNRSGFHKDLLGLTLGGGKINNPGRYLVLLPPINGTTAASGIPISRRIRVIRSRLGMFRQRSTTCLASTSRSAGNLIIEQRMFLISPGEAASDRRVGIRVPRGRRPMSTAFCGLRTS